MINRIPKDLVNNKSFQIVYRIAILISIASCVLMLVFYTMNVVWITIISILISLVLFLLGQRYARYIGLRSIDNYIQNSLRRRDLFINGKIYKMNQSMVICRGREPRISLVKLLCKTYKGNWFVVNIQYFHGKMLWALLSEDFLCPVLFDGEEDIENGLDIWLTGEEVKDIDKAKQLVLEYDRESYEKHFGIKPAEW